MLRSRLSIPKQWEAVRETWASILTSESRYMPRSRTAANGVTKSLQTLEGCYFTCNHSLHTSVMVPGIGEVVPDLHPLLQRATIQKFHQFGIVHSNSKRKGRLSYRNIVQNQQHNILQKWPSTVDNMTIITFYLTTDYHICCLFN